MGCKECQRLEVELTKAKELLERFVKYHEMEDFLDQTEEPLPHFDGWNCTDILGYLWDARDEAEEFIGWESICGDEDD